jgi:hypothetical protein
LRLQAGALDRYGVFAAAVTKLTTASTTPGANGKLGSAYVAPFARGDGFQDMIGVGKQDKLGFGVRLF